MTSPQNAPSDIAIEDILSEMDELGRAKWETALARVEAKRLRAELARVVNEQQDAVSDAKESDVPSIHSMGETG